jgi:hypothetical protein
MKLFGHELEGVPKVLVVLVVVLLMSSGLCGLSGEIEFRHHWSWFGPGLPKTALGDTLTLLDVVSAIAIVVSAFGVVLISIGWLANTLYRLIARPSKNRVQRIFGDSETTNHDKNGDAEL